jgi:S1-C subfamily serine protease
MADVIALLATAFAPAAGLQAQPDAPAVPVYMPESSPAWDQTLERIAPAVVTIEIDQARAFDTEWNQSSQATGFVVDAEKGLILTNRHVVTPGPVVATAVFQNREEVELHAVYRDPIHDFGFYRYDPAKLRYTVPPALPLYPAGARVGTEIRVVGNDAGEQLSILAGTLARLDREAPDYGTAKYNDFNTFYIQAASGTSGGSSGSPVIDIRGRVVALNAGGSTGAASSFYLPLSRVQRVLRLLQSGEPIARGTLQTVFKYTPYDELARLGLRPETETEARRAAPGLTGMLVVSEVQPGSGTEGALQPGDVLVRVNDRLVTTFGPLDEVIDNSVGGNVTLEVQRGGKDIVKTLAVQDLQEITPAEYVEFGDAVVHNLSYQMARHFNAPVRGVFVANPGYALGAAGVPRGALITSIAGRPMDSLNDIVEVLSGLADGDSATVRYSTLDDPKGTQTQAIRMDRRWFPARTCHRDDETGYWPCTDLPPGPPPATPPVRTTTFVGTGNPAIDALAPSLVMVTFDMPFSVAGISERNYHGTGLIVDATRGLVVVDRNTVPVSLGDVKITFAGSIELPGRVEYIHQLHNLAIVSFDPKLLKGTPIRAAKLEARELRAGEAVTVVGLDGDSRLRAQSTTVASVEPLALPLSRTLQYRDANLDVVSLVNPPSDFDGIVAGANGAIRALWSSFSAETGREVAQVNRGIPAALVTETLNAAVSGKPLYSIEAELQAVSLSTARERGLPDEWVRRLEAHSQTRRQVLSVARVVAGSPAVGVLRDGDLLLTIDGKVVNRFREVELATQAPKATLGVWRDGTHQTLTLTTAALGGSDIDRLLLWAGALLHAPHRAMAVQRGIPPEGVFVAYFSYGSPSTRYRLFAGRRIVEVDGHPTPDLDAFIDAVKGLPDRAGLRLRTVSWNGTTDVITLKLDTHYWPAYELVRTPEGWQRRDLE